MIQLAMGLSVILLVENTDCDIFLMRHAFVQLGLPVSLQVVTDGDQAIEYLQGVGRFANRAEYPLPVLVLLDLKLPRTSRFEVLKWIREQPEFKDLLVVILTGSNFKDDVDRAYQLGLKAVAVFSDRWRL